MQFNPPLQSATLIKRYKRFLADVVTPQGQLLTLHCPNTGAMTGCAEPGDTIWYSTSDNPKRKYPHSWELTHTQAGDWICVNTLRANGLVKEAILSDHIVELAGYPAMSSEVRYGNENSRIDLLLRSIDATPSKPCTRQLTPSAKQPDCYVEVKSVTLLQAGRGYFPDAVTLRGQKHLRELQYIVEQGQRAVLFFAVLHTGINTVSVANHIDPAYAELLTQADRRGVEILCYRATMTSSNIILNQPIAFK